MMEGKYNPDAQRPQQMHIWDQDGRSNWNAALDLDDIMKK